MFVEFEAEFPELYLKFDLNRYLILDAFLPVFPSKIICIANSHFSDVMVNTTFPVMDETIRVRAMPEFAHQDCAKLRGNGGSHKHSCVVKPLSLLNTDSITTFLSTLF